LGAAGLAGGAFAFNGQAEAGRFCQRRIDRNMPRLL